jgi:hypothetical protein
MNIAEDQEQPKGELDPLALLFRSASQKRKFSRYVKRFEQFLIDVATLYMKLAKIHMPDDSIIMAIGKKEAVNISEFKNADDMGYQVTVEPMSDDIETKLGKHIALNQALQYVGSKLDREDIGKILRAMPYGNFEESFSDLTMDHDSATNMILAIDRGQVPELNQYDNAAYMIKRLVARTRQADFKQLPNETQYTYGYVIGQYQNIETKRLADIQAGEAGFIPTGGYMVTCDLYVSDPSDTTGVKTRRARIPYEALSWLIKKLETQGQSLDELEKMNQGMVAQMAQDLQKKPQTQGPEGMVPQPEQQG